ncbi:hypothetical protein QYF36_005426 [Acer negundo]|nr:hypothetical protein QYF36_005426 [Acer negundo]
MENALPFIFILISLLVPPCTVATDHPSCLTSCGSLRLKYPFGSGSGCGSPRFHPYVTCIAEPSNQLLFTTHTCTYPITSISYTTSTITITPPCMSTCTTMQQSSNLGLDCSSPFQVGPSTFLILSCTPVHHPLLHSTSKTRLYVTLPPPISVPPSTRVPPSLVLVFHSFLQLTSVASTLRPI